MDSTEMEDANRNPTFASSLSNNATSSSSALATPSGVSVAAKRASEEQTEGPAVERLSLGTIIDPCHDPNWTGRSNEALTLDPGVLEAEFGVMVGEHFCHYLDGVGVCHSKKEQAEVHLFESIPETVIEVDKIKSKQSGSDSGYRKKEHDDLKEENDDLKKKREVFYISLRLRQVLSNFEKKPEGKIMDDGMKKEVLKLPAAKSEKIDRIVVKGSFTRILRAMHFQGANKALKSNFWSSDWRQRHRFPKFSNDDADYQWWEQNFDPEILEKRLEILRVAAKNWNPKLDMFMIIKLVSDLNSKLHPQPSENELNEKDEVKMFRLLTTICDLSSGGDSKF